MDESGNIQITRPVPVWKRPIELKTSKLLERVAKGTIAAIFGSWLGAANNGLDILQSLGLKEEPGAVAWLLVQRSLLQAMRDLVKETRSTSELDVKQLGEKIDRVLTNVESLPTDFFNNPKQLNFLVKVQDSYQSWLEYNKFEPEIAASLAKRLPNYFVHALHNQWKKNSATYTILTSFEDTPFSRAREKEMAWKGYLSWLQRRVQEPMFDENFGIASVYIPLRGYYERKQRQETAEREEWRLGRGRSELEKTERVVVDLYDYLFNWVKNPNKDDGIRVICGGPGCGKSSFTKMFAAKLAEDETRRVLFIPLHYFKLKDDLQDALQSFIDDDFEKILPPNPLKKENIESQVLLIFDGLDELAMQGKTAVEVARDFVIEVQTKLSRYNHNEAKVLVLMSGRDLAVQANQARFRQEGQILHVIPYVQSNYENKKHSYIDDSELLATDQRQDWWRAYGKLKGKNYESLPEELDRGNLFEITAQPLLNYLVAVTYESKTFNFSVDSNINGIYNHLLEKVLKRDWDNYPYPSTEKIERKDFIRILQEIAIACWHGNGRTTTIEQIKKRCESKSKLIRVLEIMSDNAQKGVIQLLIAFYFRQSEQLRDEDTFEFTHKSFGEYLTARRIVLQLKMTHKEFECNQEDSDRGWNEKTCLENWARLCGPSALDEYVLSFLRDEIEQQPLEQVKQWQQTLCKLISFMLGKGMPMERLVDSCPDYLEMSRQARNAEETLMAALSSCAYVTEVISDIEWPTQNHNDFGNWLGKLRGQRITLEDPIILRCLNHLNLSEEILNFNDLFHANLGGANLRGADLGRANLGRANLQGADLQGADLGRANLWEANLGGADLRGADLWEANLREADLGGANLERTDLWEANLREADLGGANLRGANLGQAYLEGANLGGADLGGADLLQADLRRANLWQANLGGANLGGADLGGADLGGADLGGADLVGADLGGADLGGADLGGADLRGADLREANLKDALIEDAMMPEGFEVS